MSARFRKALEGLDSRNWQLFEELASKFVSDEFDSLRTLADESGDGGRDGILTSPGDFPSIAVQYSVASDASRKIRDTGRTLNAKNPDITNLIYVTPRALATKLRDTETAHLRKNCGIHLDIRDATWFIDREDRSAVTRAAADLVGRRIVDPLLASASLLDNATIDLSGEDTRSALFFLSMQREDDDRNRGLTKSCFDALVRAVLRGTDNDNLMHRSDVHAAVRNLTPSHELADIVEYVDRALLRLERSAVRRYVDIDSFCLSYEERTRLVENMVQLQELEDSFNKQILESLKFVVSSMAADSSLLDATHTNRVRRVFEAYLFEQGESFVSALVAGQPPLFVEGDLSTVVLQDVANNPDSSSFRGSIAPIIEEAIRRTIFDPSDATLAFLHAAKEAYTLYAFLRESPNVQAAVSKIFSGGELWLDTTVVLPLLAEALLESSQRNYSRLFIAAIEADVKLYTTPGVLEEISGHLDRCRAAIRYGANFRGRSPFLLNAFVWSGQELQRFGDFEATFRGERHPEADIADYLDDEIGIKVKSLAADVDTADDELRWAVQEYWRKAHSSRRAGRDAIDPELIERLAQHDVESFLGVVQRRGGELIDNPLGYRTWWLTVDRSAVEASYRLSVADESIQLDTPVIGLEFLTYYLIAGDARRQLSKETARTLPALLDTTLMDVMPKDLVAAAEVVRKTVDSSSPRVMRRSIRDMLEADRIRSGRTGRIGIESVQYDIEAALKR